MPSAPRLARLSAARTRPAAAHPSTGLTWPATRRAIGTRITTCGLSVVANARAIPRAIVPDEPPGQGHTRNHDHARLAVVEDLHDGPQREREKKQGELGETPVGR